MRVLAGAVSPPTNEEIGALSAAELHAGIRLACRCIVLGDVEVGPVATATGSSEILSTGRTTAFERDVRPHDDGPALGVAVDIGTTTVAVGLVDLCTGGELAGATAINPQTAVGHDVLTRVRYATDPTRLEELSQSIRSCIDVLIDEVCRTAGVARNAVVEFVVAGNTAMTHLLLGADVRGLGRAPYIPQDPTPEPVPAERLGWGAHAGAQVVCLPSVSAFVGGDVVAGLIAAGLPDGDGTALLVDLGTNGELVLASGDELWGCSCAAGPAFEGMGISCGMRAAPGAIDSVGLADGRLEVSTIDGLPAAGICGSGVIDAAAALVEAGVVEPSGRFTRDGTDRPWASALRDDPRRILLATDCGGEVSFSQADVRQVQLAKGAVASGISALLSAAGLAADDVTRLLIAGQFGHHVRTDSLATLGLVPHELDDRIEIVGNTSKSGAVICLLSRRHRARAATIARGVRHVELSTLPGFDRLLARHMAFPAPRLTASV